MEMQIEWVQTVLELFVNSAKIEKKYQIELAGELEKVYVSYPKEVKEDIRRIFKEQLDISTYIYVFSYLIQYMNVEDFHQDIMTAILKQEYNWHDGAVLEVQVIRYVKGQYLQKRLFHKKNIERYSKMLELNYPYLPIEKRNKNRIVIATEQMIGLLHAPTKIVLEFLYYLQKECGYEILFIICPSNGDLQNGFWYNEIVMNREELWDNKRLKFLYKDEIFYGYQINITSETISNYQKMLDWIYTYNPLFVFNMGIINSITELAKQFTTVVTMDMSTKCPISEGNILIRKARVPEMEEEYKRCLTSKQKQVFLEQKMPVVIEKNYTICTREELGLPKDKFLVAIVGNRLDSEINTAFMDIMKDILEKTNDVVFVVIGDVNDIKEYFKEEIFENKIYYLGYCENLMGVYSTMNLYLNPKRLGGGWSSIMAIIGGVPVVTLPNCDVADNCGNAFIVQNEKEMVNTVCRYIKDKEFYESQKQIARKNGERHTDNNMIKYVKHVMDKICEAMESENDII